MKIATQQKKNVIMVKQFSTTTNVCAPENKEKLPVFLFFYIKKGSPKKLIIYNS